MTITRPQDSDSASTVPEATFSYNLTSLDTLIKSSDSTYNDFDIDFRILSVTGEEIWRANSLRPTTDFTVIEEGLRTYVRLNDQYPFRNGDQIVISHVVPQELIEEGSGGVPEEQTSAAQIEALKQQINALTTKVSQNETDIDTLENQTAAADISFYHGIISVGGFVTPESRANATSISHLTPLARAELNNPADRTEKTVSSLLLAGALVTFNSSLTPGYYSLWVAIESNDVGTGALYVEGAGGDESDLWQNAGTAVLNSKNYTIYIRKQPIREGRSAKKVFKVYE